VIANFSTASTVKESSTESLKATVSHMMTAINSAARGGSQRGAFSNSQSHIEPQSHSRMHRTMMLGDPEYMKAKVRETLSKPKYHVAQLYCETGIWRDIATSDWLSMMTLGVIVANAVWLAVDADYNNAAMLNDADIGFQVVENMFCIFFSFEWFVRFMAFRRKTLCFQDGWFAFDTCMLAVMVVETWITPVVIALSPGANAGSLSGGEGIVRIARLLRLNKLARMAKVMHAFPEIMILFKAIAVATRSVFFTLVLEIFVFYVFAILFRQTTKNTILEERYFGSILESMNGLLFASIFPDQQPQMTDFLSVHPVLGLLFIAFLVIASATILNMLVGVLVHMVTLVADVEKESTDMTLIKGILVQILPEAAEVDASWRMNEQEFRMMLHQEHVVRTLVEDVNVDVLGLIDMTDVIFQDKGTLDFPALFDIVLQLRNQNPAKVLDIMNMRRFLLKDMSTQEDRIVERLRQVIYEHTSAEVKICRTTVPSLL